MIVKIIEDEKIIRKYSRLVERRRRKDSWKCAYAQQKYLLAICPEMELGHSYESVLVNTRLVIRDGGEAEPFRREREEIEKDHAVARERRLEAQIHVPMPEQERE